MRLFLFGKIFTELFSITSDLIPIIPDLFQIIPDFICSDLGPDRDYLGLDRIFLRLYYHDPASQPVKLAYL